VATILICAPDPLSDELHDTAIWRGDNERHLATAFADALLMAVAVRPDLIVIDRDLPRSVRLIEDLRRDPRTRDVSIVVTARGEMADLELHLIQAGANAVVRVPTSRDSDERLSALMKVPARRAARVPLRLQFHSRRAPVETQWGAVLNLSATGMLVEVSTSLAIGSDVDFRFELPGAGPIVGTAQVVRQAGPQRYGAHFYGVEGDGLERIRAFVAAAPTRGRAPGAAPR
jgi:CheY-like chemotaxis protein